MFRRVISGLAVVYILYHVVFILDILPMLGSSALNITQHIGIHIGIILFLTFLLIPAKKGMPKGRPQWYDILLALVALVPAIHFAIWGEERILSYAGLSLPRDALMGWLIVLISIEAARRAVSPALAVLVALFAIYPMLAAYTPGILRSSPTSFMREGEFLYLAPDGMFGIPVWISSTVLIVFILFGLMLFALGMGRFFIDLSTSLLGHVRGGPAKVAVVGSAFFGMISGASVANVATTGSITIPMMKKIGYKPQIAGAIESTASMGGQYMPPVMGAAIFVLCAWVGIPYREVVVIAAIPAILYFLAVLIAVDLEAAKGGMQGLPRTQLPSFVKTIKQGWWFFVPIAVFLYILIVLRFSAQKAGLYSIICALLLSILRRETRPSLKALTGACEETVRTMLMVGTACMAAGIMVGCVALTGLGVRLSAGIVAISGENLILLLSLGAITSMVLGMGLPSIPCYVFLALMVAPALEEIGVPTIAAHLFVFYYGVVSFITPPVCITAYAAAGIAGSSPMKTGLSAMRIGIGAYIIPFSFCTMPAILLIGSPAEIVLAIISLVIGIAAIVIGFEGYLFHVASWLERALLFVGGVMLIAPLGVLRLVGFVCVAAGVVRQLILWRRSRLAAS